MNHGKFFSLNLSASRIENGIAVYDYTDIFDAEVNENHAQTPRFPICVSITPTSVKFILQYCVYLQNNTFVSSIDKAVQLGSTQIRHLEEVLIELPLTPTNGLSLTATLKRLYSTPFPIQLKKEKNYILELIEKRYNKKEQVPNEPNGQNKKEQVPNEPNGQNYLHYQYELKQQADTSPSNITYSSLPVYELLKKNGYELYTLHTVEENKTNEKKYEKVLKKLRLDFFLKMVHRDTKEKKYDKVLQKIVLDFFFDMMHSDVFKNSAHYDEMYSTFMSDFFCSAIIRKAEYYYQRALVNDLYSNNQSISDSINIYAANLEKAEKHWIECIQSPEADKHFEFQPNWFEPRAEKKLCDKLYKAWRHIWNFVIPFYKRVESDYWFAPPEEELQRVYYREKYGDIACSQHLCSKTKKRSSKHPISKDIDILQQRASASTKWLLKRYNFKDANRVAWFPWANTLSLFILIAFITLVVGPRKGDGILLKLYNTFYHFTESITELIQSSFSWLYDKALTGVQFHCVPTWLMGGFAIMLTGLAIYLLLPIFKYFRGGKMSFLFPRLIASIAAAWFTITLGEDLYKAFFDVKLNWCAWSAIVVFIWGFVVYEVHRIVPKIGLLRKLGRALQLIIISFAISLAVGMCVINFTGDRMLVRSGILPKAFRDDVLIHTGDNPNGDPNLVLNFGKISADSAIWTDSIVMNYYTHSPYSHLDSMGASLAVRQFADTPYDNTYMQRVANIYLGKDSLITDNAPTDLADSISLVRGRFLLNHDNSLLFKDLLPYVEHRDDNHPVAKIVPLGNYKLFLLHDFLIQFAVIAMFIGIFIQMIFEEKNVTES